MSSNLTESHKTALTESGKTTRVRYLIICILFAVSCFSYADRSALSQAVTAMPKDLDMNAERLGRLLFGFGLAYAFGQLPAALA